MAFRARSQQQQQQQQQQLWQLCVFLKLLLFLCSCASPVFSSSSSSNTRFHQSSRLSRTQQHLRRLNKPAVSTILSPDGDVIDCVMLHHQPALDHPKLKDHKIRLEAPPLPDGLRREEIEAKGERKQRSLAKAQLWHKEQERCPNGTIPIRRTKEEDLLRVSKMANYGKKRHRPARPLSVGIRNSLNENGHQHAIVYAEGESYYGAKAIINVWDPIIAVPSEFSLSQLWVLAGSFDGDLNSIEAGWQVIPDLYGDNNTRLFTYWTSDAYQGTGCYNLLCSGFVQISDQIALGATISPVSVYQDKQYDIEILIWKDPKAGDWWMSFGENHVMGYWPSSLFTYLAESATMIQWGGEVVNSNPNGQHTTTQMGSGHFPSEGFGQAAYFSNLQVVDADNNLRTPDSINTFAENSACYDVQDGYNGYWGYYFYFGGPGLNAGCP